MNRLFFFPAMALCFALPSPAADDYQPNWESLGNYDVPEWYQDAKFGIWPHWGIYSVPAYRGDHAAEWYGRWIHCIEKGEVKHDKQGREMNESYEKRGLKSAAFHRKTWGNPAEFGYHDLASLWKAEKWDPDAWAQMAVDAGAKFFCMMAMHHDSFALYGSELTEWNSVNKGPQRDLCAEMKAAAHRRGLKFGVSNHMAWNSEFFAYYHRNGFAALPGHDKLEGLYSAGVVDDAYLERWWKRTTEVVDIVSKNGVMMLNFGPKADGTVSEEYKAPLLAMGQWLAVNGDAIYATRPWVTYGEGPELDNQRQVHDHEASYTGQHIRFTRNKPGTILYATALDWPGDTMVLTTLAAGRLDPVSIQSIRLIGNGTDLKWNQTADGLEITLPPKPSTGYAYPVRIAFSGPIPELSPTE